MMISKQDITTSIGWEPKKHSVLVVVKESIEDRVVYFTAQSQIAKQLSKFGPVFLSGHAGQSPKYGHIRNWRLDIDNRYDPEVVMNYIWELKETLDLIMAERIEKEGQIVREGSR